VDFGIAKAVSDSPQDALTRSGLVIGTPEFMSPEQLLGDPVDARTDIYALGCMLFQMLSGAKPFDADSREQMIRRRLHEPPPHVRDVVPSVPKRVDTLIAHMLARSPGDRLASAAEVSASLDPALVMTGWDVDTVSSHVSIRSGRGAPTVTRQAADLGMQPTMVMKIERPNAGRVAVGALIGSVALFGGMYLWRQRQSDVLEPTVRPPIVAAARIDSTRPASVAVPPPKDTVQPQPTKRVVVDTPRPAPVVTPPPKKSVTKRDSSKTVANKPPEKPPAPPATTDETAIHETLDRFATAMGNGEVSIRNAFPGMPQALLENLKMIFAQADQVSAKSAPGDPVITGDHAEVPFTVHFQYRRRGNPVPETFDPKYTATLTKDGTQWKLTGLALRN
jgi:hypothetical protein